MSSVCNLQENWTQFKKNERILNVIDRMCLLYVLRSSVHINKECVYHGGVCVLTSVVCLRCVRTKRR